MINRIKRFMKKPMTHGHYIGYSFLNVVFCIAMYAAGRKIEEETSRTDREYEELLKTIDDISA